MNVDEKQLVRRAQAGDTEAFATLVARHQQFVYNLAWRTLGNQQEAEDMTQETFVRAWRALPRFRQQAQFRTWLYRIVVNLCYNRLPKLRREFDALGEEVMETLPTQPFENPAVHVEHNERRAFLHQQINALPEAQRLLIMLRYQQELSYQEIATIVGRPLGTVKTGLFRARLRLRKALRHFEEEK